MTVSSRENAFPGVPKVKTIEREQDVQRLVGARVYQQRVSNAGKLRAIYSQSPAQHYMTFQQFQKPPKRNKILAEYGLEPMKTPFDPVPAKRRKPNRKWNRTAQQ